MAPLKQEKILFIYGTLTDYQLLQLPHKPHIDEAMTVSRNHLTLKFFVVKIVPSIIFSNWVPSCSPPLTLLSKFTRDILVFTFFVCTCIDVD